MDIWRCDEIGKMFFFCLGIIACMSAFFELERQVVADGIEVQREIHFW